MGTTPLIEKLKTELAKVGNEVGWLWVHHRVFWDIAEIYNTTPRLQEAQTVFFDWMYFSYIEAGCIGIRRQDDTNPDSISLINVLTEIEQNAMVVLTKERFVDLLSWMPGHPFFEDPGNKERRIEAERKFDQMFRERDESYRP